jgi:zinc protease
MYRSLTLLLVAMLALLTGCQSSVEQKTLKNGLRIIVKVDRRSPVVVSQIWYRIGSMDEEPGKTGISHVLEHMMFKGTKKHGPGEFSKIIARNGGRENAFTSQDYTAYFQTLERSRLPVALELEADRMQNLIIDPKELAHEVPVVMEERRLRTEDKPEGKLYEAFRAASYRVHPYGLPIIGSMKDLRGLTADDVQAWYRLWYSPGNATLVVVGDVDPDEVFQLARRYFGPIPSKKLPKRVIASEPLQKQTRNVVVKAPAQVPRMMVGFHTPVITGDAREWEPYALDVLAGVLDGGESARFSRSLVRGQQIASSAGAGFDAVARAPSQFVLDAAPANGKSIDAVKKALLAEIEKIKSEPITQTELDRVKAQVTASDVYQRDSMFYQGMEIGRLVMSGLDYRLGDQYVDHINSVTARQVQDVARRYLTSDNMTVAVLEPQSLSSPAAKRPATINGGHHGE